MAVTGPSYVGKTTFVAYVTGRGGFHRLPVWTTRPRRSVDDPSAILHCSEDEMAALARRATVTCRESGGYLYATDLAGVDDLRGSRHVIFELSPNALATYRVALPDLKTVLLWPADFDVLQAELAATVERSPQEVAQRLEVNEELRAAPPAADIRLEVGRARDPEHRRRLLEDLRTDLMHALAASSARLPR